MTEPNTNTAPDPILLGFYQVHDYPGLVDAMEDHIAKLIDAARRNVKPWEDTFPPTLNRPLTDRQELEDLRRDVGILRRAVRAMDETHHVAAGTPGATFDPATNTWRFTRAALHAFAERVDAKGMRRGAEQARSSATWALLTGYWGLMLGVAGPAALIDPSPRTLAALALGAIAGGVLSWLALRKQSAAG